MAELDMRKHRCHRPLHDSGPAWVQQFPLLESRGDAQHSYTTTQSTCEQLRSLHRLWEKFKLFVCVVSTGASVGGTNPA